LGCSAVEDANIDKYARNAANIDRFGCELSLYHGLAGLPRIEKNLQKAGKLFLK
jgi:hypothetical protein